VGETFTQHPASSRASLQPYESALLSIFVQTRCTRTRMVELLVEVTAKRLQRWGLSQGFLTLSLCSLHGAPQVPTGRCGRVTYGKDLSGGDSCRSDLASVSAWWPQLWCVHSSGVSLSFARKSGLLQCHWTAGRKAGSREPCVYRKVPFTWKNLSG
jgi:hypothetical protein